MLAGAHPASVMSDLPKLQDLLSIVGPACAVIGAFLGLLLKAQSNRRVAENILLGFGLGGVVGTTLAFAVWLGARAAGA